MQGARLCPIVVRGRRAEKKAWMESTMAVRDQRMRRQHQALAALTRSDPFLRGDVEQALRAINRTACTTLEVARSSIWLYDEAKTRVDCRDLFVLADGSHHCDMTLSAAEYPAYFDALRAERAIAARDAHTHPATHEFSAGYLKPLGIDAMLDAPIIVAGCMVGVVCQEHIGGPREWEIDEELFTGSIADMVALTLESSRRHAAQVQLETVVSQLEQRLAQVQALVWAPLAAELQGVARVLLVPHAELGGLPFAALPVPVAGDASGATQPLGRQLQLALAASARAAWRGLQRPPRPARRLLALAESSRLPHAAAEARAASPWRQRNLRRRNGAGGQRSLHEHPAARLPFRCRTTVSGRNFRGRSHTGDPALRQRRRSHGRQAEAARI